MGNYWVIECSRHIATLYSGKVKTTEISENKLIKFLETLLFKYALTDDEILKEFRTRKSAKHTRYLTIRRQNNKLGEPLSISFSGHIADINVDAWLSD